MMRLFLGFLLVFSLYGCKSQQPLPTHETRRACQSSHSVFLYDSLVDVAARKIQADTAHCVEVGRRFSRRAINIARNIGAYPLLCRLVILEQQAKTDSARHHIALLDARYQIAERISLTTLDVSSITAEISCEEDRAREAQQYLQGWIDRRVARLNIAAITIGAVAGIATSALTLSGETDQVIEGTALAGGVVGIYLAVRSTSIKKQVVFMHPRNHLREVMENPAHSHIFSPAIWSFMTKSFQLDHRTTTGRNLLLEQWQQLGYLNNPAVAGKPEPIALLLSDGGAYSIEDLQIRVQLLQTLVSAIDLMKYDLKRLQQEIILGYKPTH